MPDFHLFRIRVVSPHQATLWLPSSPDASPPVKKAPPAPLPHNATPSNAILKALEASPESHSKRFGKWHIGGLTPLSDSGYYFKLGRITKRIEPQWDHIRRDFVDVEKAPAPYTHVLLDLETQVCGLAFNRAITQTARTLGNRLAMLLNNAILPLELHGLEFQVTEVSNPDDFITQLKEAYTIKRFSFTALRPNFPHPSDLASAAEEYARDLDARHVRLYATGKSLNAELIERQTREAVDRGGAVSARIQAHPNAKPGTIKPDRNPVILGDSDVETERQKRDTFARIKRRYEQLRRKTGDE